MNKLQARYAKVIMALMGHDPQVSDRDAVAFLQYNKFDLGAPVGDHTIPLISDKEVKEIYLQLGTVPEAMKVGDTVQAVGNPAAVGSIKEIRYIVDGLGTKHYKVDELTKL